MLTPRPAALVPALLAVSAALGPAHAQVLRFDEVPGAATTGNAGVPIGDFYNGGGGAAYNFGVAFVGNASAFCLNRPGVDPCSGTSWAGDPAATARGTERAGLAFLADGVGMNRAAGFTTGFSFYYANPFAVAATFEVWSGLDGTGALLASATMPASPNGSSDPACYGGAYCPYVANAVAFAGVARSVRFTGNFQNITYDDITFGSVTPGVGTPGVVTPEPATWALVGTGVVGVGAMARRRRQVTTGTAAGGGA